MQAKPNSRFLVMLALAAGALVASLCGATPAIPPAKDIPWPEYFSVSSDTPPPWARTVRRSQAQSHPDPFLKKADVLNSFGPGVGGEFVANLKRDDGAAWKKSVKEAALAAVAAQQDSGNTFYWQLGNEISSPRSAGAWHAWVEGGSSTSDQAAGQRAGEVPVPDQVGGRRRGRGDGEAAVEARPRGQGRGGAAAARPSPGLRNDPWLVPVFADYFLAPTIEALLEVRKETGAIVPIVLGSIGNGSSEENRAWYAQLLQHELDGRFAPSLKGKRVMDCVDYLAFHYTIDGANWQESLEDFRKWVGQGSIKGFFDTEEIGYQSTSAGTSGSIALRAFARYLHWWGKYGFTPDQVRVNYWNWDGGRGWGPGGAPAAGNATLPKVSMGVLHAFLGDTALREVVAPQVEGIKAETYAYEVKGQPKRALFVLGPRGRQHGGAFAEEEGVADASSSMKVQRLTTVADGWVGTVSGKAHIFSASEGHQEVGLAVKPEGGGYAIILDREVTLTDGSTLLLGLEGSSPAGRPAAMEDGQRDRRAARQEKKKTVAPTRWVNPPTVTVPGMEHRTLFSASMKHDVGFLVYTPPAYAAGGGRFPVVYWLHGRGHSESSGVVAIKALHELIAAGKVPPMMMVCPNGGDSSFYSDSPDGSVMGETTVIKEVIPFVDAHYRTIAAREGRALEGFSMGGFGVMKLGAKFPELFCSLVTYGGALVEEHTIVVRHTGTFELMFGGRMESFWANSPWELMNSNADRVRDALRIRMVVGTRDPTRLENWTFHELLDRLKLAHDYESLDGAGHNPAVYYERTGEKGFLFHAAAFKSAARSDTQEPSGPMAKANGKTEAQP